MSKMWHQQPIGYNKTFQHSDSQMIVCRLDVHSVYEVASGHFTKQSISHDDHRGHFVHRVGKNTFHVRIKSEFQTTLWQPYEVDSGQWTVFSLHF